MKPNRYYLTAISSFVIWGFIAFPLKQLSEFASTQILYYRILLALLCLPVILLIFRRNSIAQTYRLYKQSSKKEQYTFLICTILGSFFLTANWLLFIYVVNQINIQTASFSYLLCPILTALLGFVILKESLKPQQWLAVGISLGSCCLLGAASAKNLIFSLLVAFSYTLYLITQRALRKYDKIVLLTIQIVLSFLVIASMGSSLRGNVPTESRFYLTIFILSTVFTILPLFLNLYALKELKSATIGILMYINPLINFFVAFLFFEETASSTQVIAYFLIFLSIIMYNLNFRKLGQQFSMYKSKIPS